MSGNAGQYGAELVVPQCYTNEVVKAIADLLPHFRKIVDGTVGKPNQKQVDDFSTSVLHLTEQMEPLKAIVKENKGT